MCRFNKLSEKVMFGSVPRGIFCDFMATLLNWF